MKIIDFDGIFDKKVAEYIAKNPNKHTEEEWSDIIPRLYEKFGDTCLGKIGTTPNLYYTSMSDEELVKTLKAHILSEVPVSDFLKRELIERGDSKAVKGLTASDDEELLAIVLECVKPDREVLINCLKVIGGNFSDGLKEEAAEKVSEAADCVKEELIDMYLSSVAENYISDLLARVKERDDRIFKILTEDFLKNIDSSPVPAGRLADYGDERAIGYLEEKLKDKNLGYLAFTEIKCAIERLGGYCGEERDFSADGDYKTVMEKSESELEELMKYAEKL